MFFGHIIQPQFDQTFEFPIYPIDGTKFQQNKAIARSFLVIWTPNRLAVNGEKQSQWPILYIRVKDQKQHNRFLPFKYTHETSYDFGNGDDENDGSNAMTRTKSPSLYKIYTRQSNRSDSYIYYIIYYIQYKEREGKHEKNREIRMRIIKFLSHLYAIQKHTHRHEHRLNSSVYIIGCKSTSFSFSLFRRYFVLDVQCLLAIPIFIIFIFPFPL